MSPSADRGARSDPAREIVWVIAGRERDAGPTLNQVLAHTSEGTPVILDGGDGGARLVRGADGMSAEAANRLTRDPHDCDVAMVTAPCVVASGWLQALRDAAYRGPEIAAAVAVQEDLDDSDPADFIARAAEALARPASVARRVPAVTGACVYRRASAAQLVGLPGTSGAFDDRALAHGLSVVQAERVLVRVSGGGPEGDGRDGSRTGPRKVLRPPRRLSVLIDARALGAGRDGTRTHLLELLSALSLHGRDQVQLTALVPSGLDDEARACLASLPGLITVVLEPGESPPAELRVDVAHRPLQVSADAELVTLRRMADRVVVTHQDLISYHQPAYFGDAAAYAGYRAMTRRALRSADGVLLFSAFVRDQVIAERLADAARCHVVGLSPGSRDQLDERSELPDRPRAAGPPPGASVLLCLGSDYLHKNRPFAIRVCAALCERHAWTGQLVFAGPRVRWGSSAALERAVRASAPAVSESILDLGEVTDVERDQLIRDAALVLYPTFEEGFGLVPFEAARHGRPCLWAAGTSLAEVLPSADARIVPWDAAATADAAHRLLTDPVAAAESVASVQAAAAGHTARRMAGRLVAAYQAVIDQPPAGGADLAPRSEDAARLVGPGGLLPPGAERPLLALVTRPRVARPVFAALNGAYRASAWLARRR